MIPEVPEVAAIKNRWRKRVERLAERDGWLCQYCGVELSLDETSDAIRPTIDHVIPRSKGGTNKLGNQVLACPECNKKKGSKAKLPSSWSVEQHEAQQYDAKVRLGKIPAPLFATSYIRPSIAEKREKRPDYTNSPRRNFTGSRAGQLKKWEDPMHEDVLVEYDRGKDA